jgi:catechol 2,3-dioxygenase-like lactoylglutathione lyase family enzyme
LRFYTELLGMRLLSVQPVPAREFTLYFLACTDEVPPHADVEHVGNREWLWQRPYSILELQHIWGTEERNDFAYRTGAESGFESISFATRNLSALLDVATQQERTIDIVEQDSILRTKTATVLDPDGYAVRLINKAEIS